jgi:hypothetical protein
MQTTILILFAALGLIVFALAVILILARIMPGRFFWVHEFLTYAVEPGAPAVRTIMPVNATNELTSKYNKEKWDLKAEIHACWKRQDVENLVNKINRFDFAYRDIIPQDTHYPTTENLRSQLDMRIKQLSS